MDIHKEFASKNWAKVYKELSNKQNLSEIECYFYLKSASKLNHFPTAKLKVEGLHYPLTPKLVIVCLSIYSDLGLFKQGTEFIANYLACDGWNQDYYGICMFRLR